MVTATSAAAGESVQIIHPSGLYVSGSAPSSGSWMMVVSCPVPKDMTVTLYKWTASLNGADPVVTFVPCMNSNPGDASPVPSSSNNYSAAEVWTGQTWVDGSKIYRKVIPLGSFTINNTTWTTIGTATALFGVAPKMFVNVKVIGGTLDTSRCVNDIDIHVSGTDIQIIKPSGAMAVNGDSLMVEYVKA